MSDNNKFLGKARTQELVNDIKSRFTAVNTALEGKLDKSDAPYIAGGSFTFANIPAASEAHLGLVYNITDAFTTTADFVEGEGIDCSPNTDVAVVKTGSNPDVYKYNLFGGQAASDIESITSAELQEMWKDDGSIILSSTSVTVTEGANDSVTITSATGDITVTSGNEDVATVELTGNSIVITGVLEGNTAITVTSASTSEYKAATATITVAVVSA